MELKAHHYRDSMPFHSHMQSEGFLRLLMTGRIFCRNQWNMACFHSSRWLDSKYQHLQYQDLSCREPRSGIHHDRSLGRKSIQLSRQSKQCQHNFECSGHRSVRAQLWIWKRIRFQESSMPAFSFGWWWWMAPRVEISAIGECQGFDLCCNQPVKLIWKLLVISGSNRSMPSGNIFWSRLHA